MSQRPEVVFSRIGACLAAEPPRARSAPVIGDPLEELTHRCADRLRED
jgi:hypothetical protein